MTVVQNALNNLPVVQSNENYDYYGGGGLFIPDTQSLRPGNAMTIVTVVQPQNDDGGEILQRSDEAYGLEEAFGGNFSTANTSNQEAYAVGMNPPGNACIVAEEYDSTATTPTHSL